jgi:outer membrane protein assembly factor BamB
MNRTLLTILALLPAASLLAGDWTQFRGPTGQGISTETGLPVHWGPKENLRWQVDLPGRGLSSPVIAAGRVYVTACSGPDQERLHVLCLDEATGKTLWHRQFWATGTTMCHPKTCMAAPTPATDGKRVYALFASHDLVCLDAQGDLLWFRSLTRDYPTVGNNVGMASSPILSKDRLILVLENAGESYGLGIDKLTGKNRWKVTRPRGINWVTPLLITNNGREEVLFQGPADVAAHDPQTGRKAWSFQGSGLSTIPTPVFGGGLIFVPGGKFLALRPGGADASPRSVWENAKLQTSYASPLYYQGYLYTVNSVDVLTCTDALTGKIQCQERLKGPFAGSPIAADGKIYLVNEQGLTSVVQAGKTAKVLAANTLPDTILACPVIANGAIYLRSDKHLYCIGKKNTKK